MHLGHKFVALVPQFARNRSVGSLLSKTNHMKVLNLAGNLSFQNQVHAFTSLASELIRSYAAATEKLPLVDPTQLGWSITLEYLGI